MRKKAVAWRGWALGFQVVCVLAGCKTAPTPSMSGGSSTGRPAPFVHEPCEGEGEQVANNPYPKGVSPIQDVYKGGKLFCRIFDFDRDGTPDVYEYFTPEGVIRRRETRYGPDSPARSVSFFENGKLVRQEIDSTDKGIDTWDFFDPATGIRVRRERDTNGDGRVDQWWTWKGEELQVQVDSQGTGQPDPRTTFVLGGGDRTKP